MLRRIGWLALLAVLVGAGCSVPSNAPEGYGDVTRANFVDACVRSAPSSGDADDEVETVPRSVCECRYEWFEANVPFDDEAKADDFPDYDGKTFVQLDDQQSDDPGLPQDMVNELNETCPPEPTSTSTSEPTSSTAAD